MRNIFYKIRDELTAQKVSVFGVSGPYFPAFGLNTDQKNLEYVHFSGSDSFSTTVYG